MNERIDRLMRNRAAALIVVIALFTLGMLAAFLAEQTGNQVVLELMSGLLLAASYLAALAIAIVWVVARGRGSWFSRGATWITMAAMCLVGLSSARQGMGYGDPTDAYLALAVIASMLAGMATIAAIFVAVGGRTGVRGGLGRAGAGIIVLLMLLVAAAITGEAWNVDAIRPDTVETAAELALVTLAAVIIALAVVVIRDRRGHRAADSISVRCPRCGSRGAVHLGGDRCSSCGLQIRIRRA